MFFACYLLTIFFSNLNTAQFHGISNEIVTNDEAFQTLTHLIIVYYKFFYKVRGF